MRSLRHARLPQPFMLQVALVYHTLVVIYVCVKDPLKSGALLRVA